ncbi:hypothetical protein A9Q78_02580 [Methylophaga sp. 41_12_T18]|nr:hypothetical protein A9Q78_02580 [Methylophaga sp. 41_12_T18]
MKVCGVELKANDAIISLMDLTDGLYTLLDCRVKKISIQDASDRDEINKFQFDFDKLMEDYQVDHIVVRERMTKGKFAGGSVSFKLEAAIQLLNKRSVSLLSPARTKEILKQSKVVMDFDETGLKQFQEQAFMTAFAYLESL